MLRALPPLVLGFIACAGPSTQVSTSRSGKATEIVLTNFCDDDIEYGFSPNLDSKPPIRMQLCGGGLVSAAGLARSTLSS